MKKRVLALMLMMVLCFTAVGIVGQNKVAKAAEGDLIYLLETQTLVGEFTAENMTATCHFTNDTKRDVSILLMLPAAQDVNVVVTNTETAVAQPGSLLLSDWQYSADTGCFANMVTMNLEVGVYQLDLLATQPGPFVAAVIAENKKMEISVPSFTITAGQKKTLEVFDAPDKVTWSSNKPAVASVSAKGVVTAKKAGKAVITATSGDQKVKCTVTVKKNEYKGQNITFSDVMYGCKASITKVAYKGKNLSVNVKFVNKQTLKITKINKLNIKITDSQGKKIASYTFKNLSGISPQSQKTYKLTIPKKYVKKKNADLRYAICDGDFNYTYTY